MSKVSIIFSHPHTALRDSGGFKMGELIKEVNFDVYSYRREGYGLLLRFEPCGAEYTYPWHTIDRLKIED